MPLRVQHLEPDVRRGRISQAVEDRIGIVLLRLVIEDEDDLAARVQARVVVVMKLRSRDSEAGEHDRRGCFHVAREEADEVLEELVTLLRPAAPYDELCLLNVG